jgi:hypothetical protein
MRFTAFLETRLNPVMRDCRWAKQTHRIAISHPIYLGVSEGVNTGRISQCGATKHRKPISFVPELNQVSEKAVKRI